MRRRMTLAAVATLGLTLAACGGGGGDAGGDATGGGDGGGQQVEVFTWWAAGSEKAALDALVEEFNNQYPDIEFINGAVAGGAGSAAKDLLQSRLQANDPPDTFQGHAGEELRDYIEAGQIEDVSYLYDEYGLRDVFPQDLIDLLTVEDAIYSIPANIHRSNVVWANPAVLEEAGLDPAAVPEDLDAWIEDLRAVEEAGKTPLSLGMPWTQVHLLETVLMADLGADAYNGLYDGSTDWEGPEVTSALEKFETLVGFTNTDRDGLDWPEATQMVIDGTAAYNVMGDWALAAFDEQEQVAGEDYVYFPVPGSDGMFGFLADSFTIPVGARNVEGAEAWLDTVGSLEGQVAFNRVKGSIPARTDAEPGEFSEYQQDAMESYANDRIVPSLAHGAATSLPVLNAVTDATSKFTSGASDLAAFQSELAAAVTQS